MKINIGLTMSGLCDCCEEQCDELIPATDYEYWVCPQCVLALVTG